MDLQQRINVLAGLGRFLGTFGTMEAPFRDPSNGTDPLAGEMAAALEKAKQHNGWFTHQNLKFALQSWSEALTEEKLQRWAAAYTIADTPTPKTVAIVMAGNIPLVGLHDMLSVLLTGNKVLAKLSSNDKFLLPAVSHYLVAQLPKWEEYIAFAEETLGDFDAVIATGSNNTARYFDYYFGKYPNIIRRNRNSVAVLTGKETLAQLEALSNDIFRYFGLGCRNVSKLFVPHNYSFDAFFQAMFKWKDIIHNHKYINNYDYNKAVYLMGNSNLLDNEFLLLKEDLGYSSPISVVFYERYSEISEVEKILIEHASQIQAVVADAGIPGQLPFGKAQRPQLWEYADGIDTVAFLLTLPA